MGHPPPPPLPASSPPSEGVRLVPTEGAPGDLGGVTWDILCYFLSVMLRTWVSQQGSPTIAMAETPTCLELTNGTWQACPPKFWGQALGVEACA